MLLICYPRCTTCRKAEQWLKHHQVDEAYRDLIIKDPEVAELTTWYQISGLPLRRFWNTSGIRYRNLNLKDRLSEMSEIEQIELLATDGLLIRRPLLVGDDFVLVGFREKVWIEQLLSPL